MFLIVLFCDVMEGAVIPASSSISGLNFCGDLPSPFQCDCGIEKTLPQKSKVEGAKVR